MESPPLTILLPTHGRPTLLKRTLDSLVQCALPDSYQELVVIENGSRAGAEAVVGDLPARLNARYMHCERGNKSYALNQALDTINQALDTIVDGLVVLFDDDVRVHPQVLVRYAEAAYGVVHSVLFGGPTDVDYESPPPDWLLEYLPPSAKGWATDGNWQNEDFGFFLGFNWAAFTVDLRSIGGFNANLGPGTICTGQETEMQKRLVGAGAKQAFVPGAKVWHYVPKQRCSPLWALRRHFRNGITEGALRHFHAPALLGMPKWAMKETARSLYMATRDILMGKRVAAFSSAVNICRYLGIMHGARQRVNDS